MNCPLCNEKIKDGAKVCKHCKGKIIECPNCLEYTDGNNKNCIHCETPILEKTKYYEDTKSFVDTSKGDAKLSLMKNKKSFGFSLFLNVLWAGSGVYYAKSPNGRWIAWLNILFFLLSFVTVGIASLLLFVWSSIICYRHLKVYNAELEISIERGELESFLSKYKKA